MQDKWIAPLERYCGNCGMHLYGCADAKGFVKFQCPRCGMVCTMKKKSRRLVHIEEYAPQGEQFI